MEATIVDVLFWPATLIFALAMLGMVAEVIRAMLQTLRERQVHRVARGPVSRDQILASTWEETHAGVTFHGPAAKGFDRRTPIQIQMTDHRRS